MNSDHSSLLDVGGGLPEEDVEEPIIPYPLTTSKKSGLTSAKFEYSDDLPEYPATDTYGYSYVVASNGRTQLEMEKLSHDIQYARRQQYGQRRPVYCPFFRCHVKKWTWKCSGVYACEFLSPFLQSSHHKFVDETLWQAIQRSQANNQSSELDVSKRNAYSFYRAKVAFFKRGLACLEQLPSCKPVFKRYPQMNIHGDRDPYIGCINDSYDDFLTKHHRAAIKGHAQINLLFLEDLFNKEVVPTDEECGIFEPMSSRRKYCEKDHPQGSGRLQHTPCDVNFNALVPVDINQYPYILFTSHGVHKHPPPPPTKPPQQILQGVKRIIEQMRDPSSPTAQFLRNPQLEAFCQQHDDSTLTEIHASFCNEDRIASIIQKQRLLSYPSGQDVNGLIFLENTDQHIRKYVQEKYHDSQNTTILCGFKQQIELLSQLSSFEVDMSYKRIRSKSMNEVVFTTFLTDQCKVITLLRVFTTVDSAEGYYLLFKRVFELVQRITGRPVLFDPIHGTGIHGIIVVMDSKQYSGKYPAGLGRYLSAIDPQKHDSTWHLQHIIMFCRVHFQRSILNAIGTKAKGSNLWFRMMSLLSCTSEEAYDELIDLLTRYESDAVKNWAEQKKNPIIKAGLNKACSKIKSHYYDVLRSHTDAAEQSHNKAYASGRYLTLAEAVGNSAKLDKDDILQYENFNKFNVDPASRTSNMDAWYQRDMAHDKRQKRQRSSSAIEGSSEERPSQRSRRTSYAASNDDAIETSSRDLRRTASTNASSLELRRQELELRKLEADIRKQEADIRKQDEETHLKRLQNEKFELDLMERRNNIQEQVVPR